MAARTIIRVTSVTLSLGLILAFAITAASADLPGCRNCIEAKDIATGGVGSAEIKNGSIRRGDIALSALPAAGTVLLDQLASTNSVTGDTLDSFKVKAPGPGVLMVQVTGKYWFEVSAGSGQTGLTKKAGTLALCTSANAVSGSACGASSAQEEGIFYADADSESGDKVTPFFGLHRVVPVGKAGTTTFYLNGKVENVVEPMSLYGPVRAIATFFPRGLTVTP